MSFSLLKVALEALPIIISGASLIFKSYKHVPNIQPGEYVEIPTGYKVSDLPANHCFEICHTDATAKKGLHMAIKNIDETSKTEELVMKVVNLGKTLLSIEKGEAFVKGALKGLSYISPSVTVQDVNSEITEYRFTVVDSRSLYQEKELEYPEKDEKKNLVVKKKKIMKYKL